MTRERPNLYGADTEAVQRFWADVDAALQDYDTYTFDELLEENWRNAALQYRVSLPSLYNEEICQSRYTYGYENGLFITKLRTNLN